MAKPTTEECQMDMTPMIDVVFQLIIFFVVTLQMTTDMNKDIVLEEGKDGVTLTQDNMPPTQLEIELDYKGRISLHNITYSLPQLQARIVERVRKHGTDFPVLIRADQRAEHWMVKQIMDVCTACGVWKLSFVAIQEHKGGK